jgi:branched-chain amino acid transport system ATP-binding protein
MPPLLEVQELQSGYKDVPVLHGISFQINAGEIVTIVGSNGAGKTTLLRTISGLLSPTEGAIRFAGEAMHGLEPHLVVEKGIVQVPEGRQLFGHLTVYENLMVGSHIKEARKQRRETLQMIFDLFPVLAERRNQLARTLSGGEQQMLATARALMARPKLLMLDEPSWGLAPMLVRRLFETILQINRQGVTIFLVEQNVYQALSMAHRAYVLERGTLVMQGGGKELLENPELKAAYLGL